MKLYTVRFEPQKNAFTLVSGIKIDRIPHSHREGVVLGETGNSERPFSSVAWVALADNKSARPEFAPNAGRWVLEAEPLIQIKSNSSFNKYILINEVEAIRLNLPLDPNEVLLKVDTSRAVAHDDCGGDGACVVYKNTPKLIVAGERTCATHHDFFRAPEHLYVLKVGDELAIKPAGLPLARGIILSQRESGPQYFEYGEYPR